MTKEISKIDSKIIQFLETNGPSFLGEVVKALKISNSRGLSSINRLKSKGIIRHSNPRLQYELNSEKN
ncbi:MAG: Lrp/AsnC family transcriptional regulator [Draconibacterium sp.]